MYQTRKSKILAVFCSAALVITSMSFSFPKAVYGGENKVVTGNEVWGHTANTPEEFAGIYEFDNLTLSAGAHITSNKISQLVIKVNGVLTIEEGADIRVRNGFYPGSPVSQIVTFNSGALKTQGISKGMYSLYPNAYGKGGNGGRGGNGLFGGGSTDRAYYGGSGGGGGGGYGGGLGGASGSSINSGYSGSQNGGYGGNGGNSGDGGSGGGAAGVGSDGDDGRYGGNGGSGGGGNGGYGGRGAWSYGQLPYRIGGSGSGGGGGGYGGGILTIIAERIVINSSNPCLIVSGQKGGAGGNQSVSGDAGQNGEGGMLVVYSNNYAYNENQWKITSAPSYSFGQKRPEFGGGHGVNIGNPQKVFINGAEYGLESIPKEGITAAVTGISFKQKNIAIKVGERANIEADVLPANAGNKNYRLINNAPDIAVLNNNTVIGLKKGTADIIALTDEGSFTDICSITVTGKSDAGNSDDPDDTDDPDDSNNTGVSKVSLSNSSLMLQLKETYQLKAVISPSNASNKSVKFKSSNKKIADVTGKGKITAKKVGKAVITVTAANGKKASCAVKIVKKLPLKFTKSNVSIKVKKTLYLKKYISPVSAAERKISWSSQNKKIAKVSSKGTVTGLKKGKTYIYAQIGSAKIKIRINVK